MEIAVVEAGIEHPPVEAAKAPRLPLELPRPPLDGLEHGGSVDPVHDEGIGVDLVDVRHGNTGLLGPTHHLRLTRGVVRLALAVAPQDPAVPVGEHVAGAPRRDGYP